jgi:hypothetical protein
MSNENLNCYTSIQFLDQVNNFLNNKDQPIFDIDGLIVVQLHIIKLVDSIKNYTPNSKFD